jgi:hypothetical protein
MDSDTKVSPETTPSQPSPDRTSEYCDECIQADRALHEVAEALAHKSPERILVPMVSLTDFTAASRQNACPSCRDILKASAKLELEFWIFEFELNTSAAGHSGWANFLNIDGHGRTEEAYLLKRSRYPAGLREPIRDSLKSFNVDIGFIQEHLQTCESHHDSCRAAPIGTSDIALYLVDVLRECITSTPISGVRYVALSYVWGDSQVTKLTSKNTATLAGYRGLSLDSQVHIVPRTIRDAMRLTAELGIRYLWVDCLCIVQDDPNIGYYLNRMHSVYSDAYLTIVVANKDSADGGIVGYETYPESRNLPRSVITYPNYVLGIIPLTDGHTNTLFPWATRGWTLQEGFFSRRALTIDDRMTFVCAASWAEEGDIVGGGIHGRPGYLCNATPYRDQVVSFTDPMLHRRNLYSHLQEVFASRELTYDTDVQRACSGITSFFSRPDEGLFELNTQILYGHQLLSFRNTLLWRSRTPQRKRNTPSRRDGLPAVPSWSWMAWHGHQIHTAEEPWTILYDGRDLDEPTKIEFQCHACHKIHPVTHKNCTDEPSSSPSGLDELDTYLYIRAQRGRFGFYIDIDGDCHIVLQSPQEELGRELGHLFFDDASIHSTLTGSETFDFIGIYWHDTYEFGEQNPVYALCVRRAQGRPDVFERIGMAKIHKEAWDMVAEFDENIVLG